MLHHQFSRKSRTNQAKDFEISNVFPLLCLPYPISELDLRLGNVCHQQHVYQTISEFFASEHDIFLLLYFSPRLILEEYQFEFEGNWKIDHEKIERARVMVNKYWGVKLLPCHKKESMVMSPMRFEVSLY
jgi:hypothetical protein